MFLNHDETGILKQPIRGGARVKLLTLNLLERIYSFAFSPDHTQLLIARGRPQSRRIADRGHKIDLSSPTCELSQDSRDCKHYPKARADSWYVC